jgi:mono/diheme cytochrome c family protein
MDTSCGFGWKLNKRLRSLLCLNLCWGLVLVVTAQSRTGVNDGAAGEAIFKQKCASCHSVSAQDVRDHDSFFRAQGPSLTASGNKYSAEWLQKWLSQPAQVWPAGYLSFRHVIANSDGDRVNDAWSPNHVSLSSPEAQQVANYLMSLKKEPNQYPIARETSEIPGKLLFEKVFGCGSCHQAEPGQDGRSGPELYTAAQRLNKDWVRQFIADPQYWGSGLMVKSNLGAAQLEAIVDYLFQPKKEMGQPRLLTSKADSEEQKQGDFSQVPQNRKLYLLFCSQCHGVQGNGKGLNAKSMSTAPRNHTSSEEMAGLTDERLFAAIKFGGTAVGKSSLMPSWATLLTDSDIDSLIGYLHKLGGSEVSGGNPVPASVSSLESRLSK